MEKGYKNTINIIPSERQIEWQKTEFYGLVSYGMPVFTGKQYGDGHTPASMFWPEAMDTDSWCAAAKSAGNIHQNLLMNFSIVQFDLFCFLLNARII